MRVLLAMLLAAASGCGGSGNGGGADPAAFDGVWSGTLVSSGSTCSDGTSTPATSGAVMYLLTEAGTTVSWMIGCGATFSFDVGGSGNSATQQGSATCPAIMENGSAVVSSYSNGSLTLKGDALSVMFDGRNDRSGLLTGDCTFAISGTLARQ